MLKLVVVVVFVLVFQFVTLQELPSNYQRCKRSAYDFDVCLRSAIQYALIELKNGIPDINFPTFDPLYIPKMTAGEGTGAVHVVQKFTKINFTGLSQTIVNNVSTEINENNIKLTLIVTVPQATAYGDYDLDGKILVLPIVGQGKFVITFDNLDFGFYIRATVVKKKGATYLEIKESKLTITPALIKMKLENLFDGDERLGDVMNLVLNDNWKVLWNDVKHSYEDLFGAVYYKLADTIFKNIPYDELFPI